MNASASSSRSSAERWRTGIEALGSASPLGNLVGATIKPDPERQAPAPPYDDEVAAWTVLVERFGGTLDWDGERG